MARKKTTTAPAAPEPNDNPVCPKCGKSSNLINKAKYDRNDDMFKCQKCNHEFTRDGVPVGQIVDPRRENFVAKQAINRLVARTGRQPTSFQINVFSWLLTATGHAFVEAVAGSGKTTTLEWAARLLEGKRILLLAFNKSIANELTARIPNYATAKTLHSLGMGACRSLLGNFTVDDDKTARVARGVVKYDEMSKSAAQEFDKALPAINRVVGLFKNFAFATPVRGEPTADDIQNLVNRHGIEAPEDMPFDAFCELCINVFDESIKNTKIIDFDDMIYLPVKLGAPLPTYYDFIFVDESQDLNPAQIEMVRMMTRGRTRAVFVGDRCQAIYGFRGADPEAINSVIDIFKATTLPLSICWRCPKAVIAEAQRIVPQIEAAPNAEDGIVQTIKEDEYFEKVGGQDFVLCRVMAPLVDHCFKLIREGIKATVKGRDIGVGLANLCDKVAKSRAAKNADGIYEKIEAYKDDQAKKLSKKGKENQLINMMDRLDTLLVLSVDCADFACIKEKIKMIFSDDNGRGVTFSTIHRAKGLESENIYILHPEALPHPMAKQDWQLEQERNLRYVAITRATRSLTWVTPDQPLYGNSGGNYWTGK